MEIREIPFIDALSTIVDNRGKTAPTSDSGIPLIATNCISNDSLYPVFKDVRYVDDETYKTWFRGHPEPDDILFVNKGSPGRVCLVPNPVDFVIAQDMVSLRVNPEITTPDFLLALLRSEEVQRQIGNMHVGTLIPHFKKGDFQNLFLKFPDLSTQKVIGSVYRSFSDKIELNRRMNRTLEQMARALFKSWFVDFDPVRAKMRGEQPEGMDAATAALFPSELVEVDGREVPKGWEIKGLDEIADFLNGLALQKFPPTGENDLPVIKIAQLRKGNTEGSGFAARTVGEKYIVKDGDILFSWSGSLEVVRWSGGEGALNQHLFKVTSSEYPNWFIFWWLLEHLPEFQAIAANKATTMGHIQRKHLNDAKAVLPPKDLLLRLGESIYPLFESMFQNDQESARLAQLRDALLPRLLSGEVDVSEWGGNT